MRLNKYTCDSCGKEFDEDKILSFSREKIPDDKFFYDICHGCAVKVLKDKLERNGGLPMLLTSR